MKKRFFKKLKKYILVLSCVLSCLVILSLPVHAASSDLLNSLINNGTLRVEGTTNGIPGLNGSYASGEVVFKTLPVLNLIENYENIESTNSNFYLNAREISDRLVFTTSSNSILLKKGSSFEGTIYGFSINWIIDTGGTLGYIWLNSDVDISFKLNFRTRGTNNYTVVNIDDFFYSSENGGYLSFNCPYVPVDCDSFILELIYNTDDSHLIDERAKMPLSYFIKQRKVATHQFQIIDFKIDFSSTVPPLSEQPIYSKPSTGGIDNTTSQEQIIVDNSVQDAQDEFGKLSNSIANIVKDTKLYNSILGVRYMFERLLQESPFLSDILVVSLICGIVLLFSNFIVNRRRD